MARQYSGIDGRLLVNGNNVGKVRNWTINGSVDTLETTSLADFARDYSAGLQSYQGSATLFYYENDAGVIEGAALYNDVFRTTRTPEDTKTELSLRFANGNKTRQVTFDCILNQVDVSASAGEVVEANINFTVCGPLKTNSLQS
jgi:hypothetical protein